MDVLYIVTLVILVYNQFQLICTSQHRPVMLSFMNEAIPVNELIKVSGAQYLTVAYGKTLQVHPSNSTGQPAASRKKCF